jgi:hypothetical protein
MPQIFVKIKRHLYWVVTHFEIWAASQIFRGYGSVLPESAEQRLGSRCGPVRVEPPVRGGSIATARPRPLLDVWLFLQPDNSQFSNCQIRNRRISTEAVTPCSESWGRARSVVPKPILSPVPPVLSGAHQARSPPQLSPPFSLFAPK